MTSLNMWLYRCEQKIAGMYLTDNAATDEEVRF